MNLSHLYQFRRCIWLSLFLAGTWVLSGCFMTQKAQTRQIAGRYRCTTDFSRDIQTMRGNNRTVVYKQGREETLQFKPDHKFTRTIRFSTESKGQKTHRQLAFNGL